MKGKSGPTETKIKEKRLTVKPGIKREKTGIRRENASATVKSKSVPKEKKKKAGNDSDSDEKTEYIINETKVIRENVLDSMSKFKEASGELCQATQDFLKGFNKLSEEFTNVKKEIKEIIDETMLSKQDISKLQVKLEEGNKDGEIKKEKLTDLVGVSKEETKQKVLVLKKKVDELKGDLIKNEEETKANNFEYEELRSCAYKIQDTFEDVSDNEDSKNAACRACFVF